MTIKAGDVVKFRPERQDPGDESLEFVAVENEAGGRVKIECRLGLPINPTQIVDVQWIESGAQVWKRECSREEWEAFIATMRSGEVFEVDAEMYDYWLGVLPPVFMREKVRLPNGEEQVAWFGFAEGPEPIVAFWGRKGRYFGCQTDQINERR